MPTTVRDAMSTDLIAASRQTSIVDAEQMLLAYGVDELFVVDEQGWLCGVVPDYELLKARMMSRHDARTVEDIMSRRLLVIGPESSLTVAGRYLREHIHRRLAVVEDRRLIGQITRHSVLAWLRSQSESGQDTRAEPDQEMMRRLDEMHPPMLLRRGATRVAAPTPQACRTEG